MCFNIIKTIGPISIPKIPIILNPVYIAIKVNIGCIPICPETIRGSINCLTILIMISNTIIAIPNVKSPLNATIIAHGIITEEEPNIGSASTNPIAKAAIKGYGTFKPTILNKYSPIRDITKDTNTNITSAFNSPPNDLLRSFINL